METATSEAAPRAEALAESTILETCAAVLVGKPSREMLDAASCLAEALGRPLTSDTSDADALEQRFYDRFLIPSSPWFVPSNEQCIRMARDEGGRIAFPSIEGVHSRHVAACYREAGFDFRRIEGYAPAVGRLLPDSLVAELAFVSSMRLRESQAETENEARGLRAYADRFTDEHLGRWVGRYAELARSKGADFYMEWIDLTAHVVELGRSA